MIRELYFIHLSFIIQVITVGSFIEAYVTGYFQTTPMAFMNSNTCKSVINHYSKVSNTCQSQRTPRNQYDSLTPETPLCLSAITQSMQTPHFNSCQHIVLRSKLKDIRVSS